MTEALDIPFGEDLERVREALAASDGIDSRRIEIALDEDGSIVLRGWVASESEAIRAITIAEAENGTRLPIVDELQIDEGLREGEQDILVGEPATPAPEEVLVGSVDMLAGPDAEIEQDFDVAMSEGEPWIPPDEPTFPGTARQRPLVGRDDIRTVAVAEEMGGRPTAQAEPDSPAEARASMSAPSPAGPPLPTEDAVGIEAADEATDRPEQVDRVPGTEAGPGAVGSRTAGGGSIGGTPAVETGARGVDQGAADPARITGTTAAGGGTHRGPEAEDDPAIRDDYSSRD